jgi:hypothetical protein
MSSMCARPVKDCVFYPAVRLASSHRATRSSPRRRVAGAHNSLPTPNPPTRRTSPRRCRSRYPLVRPTATGSGLTAVSWRDGEKTTFFGTGESPEALGGISYGEELVEAGAGGAAALSAENVCRRWSPYPRRTSSALSSRSTRRFTHRILLEPKSQSYLGTRWVCRIEAR